MAATLQFDDPARQFHSIFLDAADPMLALDDRRHVVQDDLLELCGVDRHARECRRRLDADCDVLANEPAQHRFEVRDAMHFPAVTLAERRAGAAGPRVQKDGDPLATILLAEDEDSVRSIICTVLRRQGYRVLEASSGRAACDIFDRQGSQVDLLLTDVVMPEMNGPALAQRLVALQPQLRVLFISGYSEISPLDPSNPNISFLSKPFQASALAGKVRQVLSRHASPV